MALVTVGQVRDYAGIDAAADEGVLEQLIDLVELNFLRQIGRSDRPFQAAETGRVEVLDGSGTSRIWVRYPIAALTTITLGRDPSAWAETLDLTDPAVVSYQVGGRRIARVDGGRFGCQGEPDYVRVTYNAQEDVPEDVQLAIVRMVKALYEESGRGEATAERALGESENLPQVADVITSDFWQATVDAYRELAL